MSILNKAVFGALAVCFVAGAFAQTTLKNSPGTQGATALGGVHAADNFSLEVPHLIYQGSGTGGGTLGPSSTLYRPEVINLDGLTIADVLRACGTTIDENLIVQAVRLEKDTPWWKCLAFVSGPGSGSNTNFTTGFKKATNDDLTKHVVNIALGLPQDVVGLGNRALLFSPPNTKYTIKVVYVVRDPITGRIGAPMVCVYVVMVKVPTVTDIRAAVDYFSTVAAGATQKPKITWSVVKALNLALDETDPLAALIAFETVVAEKSVDFTALLAAGDVRFYHGYMIDDSEEPIGCLLIEMANAALWF
jgi:hypothetical protein